MGELVNIEAKLVDPTLSSYKGLPHIGGNKIESVTGKLDLINTAEEDGVISGKYMFSSGDILYSKIRPYLRKTTSVTFEGLCSADIYPLNVVKREKLLPEFLRWALVSKPFTEYAIGVSSRARMPKLNRSQLFKYCIGLPTIEEQAHIAAYLENMKSRLFELKDAYTLAMKELNTLECSILNDAFRGEL